MFYMCLPTLVYERSLPYKIYIESIQAHDTQHASHTNTYVCTLHIIPMCGACILKVLQN